MLPLALATWTGTRGDGDGGAGSTFGFERGLVGGEGCLLSACESSMSHLVRFRGFEVGEAALDMAVRRKKVLRSLGRLVAWTSRANHRIQIDRNQAQNVHEGGRMNRH